MSPQTESSDDVVCSLRELEEDTAPNVPGYPLLYSFVNLHTPLSLPLSRHPITDSDIQSLNVSLSEFSPAFNEDKGYFINMNSSHFFSFLFPALIRKVNNSMWMFSYILIFSLHVLFNLCYLSSVRFTISSVSHEPPFQHDLLLIHVQRNTFCHFFSSKLSVCQS